MLGSLQYQEARCSKLVKWPMDVVPLLCSFAAPVYPAPPSSCYGLGLHILGLKLVYFVATSSSHHLTSVSLPFLMSIVNGRSEGYGTGLALFADFTCLTRGAELVFNGPEYGLPVHGGWTRLLTSSNKLHMGLAQYLVCTPGVPLFAADAMRLGLGQMRVSDQPQLTIKGDVCSTHASCPIDV